MALSDGLTRCETLRQGRMPRGDVRKALCEINARVSLAAFVVTHRTDRRGGYDEIQSKQDDVAIHSASHRDTLYRAANVHWAEPLARARGRFGRSRFAGRSEGIPRKQARRPHGHERPE